MRFEGFCGQTYEAPVRNFAADRCINLYPEFDRGGTAKSKVALVGTPGLQSLISFGSGSVRTLWAGDNRVFGIAGPTYGEIISPGVTFQNRGTIADNGRPAQILSNGTQLLIVSAGSVYYDNGGAATGSNATLVAGLSASYGTYLDGYFLVVDFTQNHVRYSGLFDGSAWNPLDFFARASSRDALTAVVADDGQLWTFGRRFIEVYWNSGNADSPFQPIDGSGITQGVVYPETIVKLAGSLFFPSEDDRGYCGVFRTRGFQLEKVSNPAIDAMLKTFGTNQVAWAEEDDGHQFYVITEHVSTANRTALVYDVSMNMWHERALWFDDGFAQHFRYPRARCHCFTTPGFVGGSTGAHLIGDRLSNTVYQQSPGFFTDGVNTPIRRYRQAPHLHDENKNIFYHRFELDVNVGDFSGTPEALLKWSDDDGFTFSADIPASLGLIGERKTRVIWRRLGKSRDRIFGVTFHDLQGRLMVNDAYLELTLGNA